MQRSWGSTGHGVFQKQPGGWCGIHSTLWNRVSKEGRGGGQRGDKAGHAGSWGPQGGFGFFPKGNGSLGGLWTEDRA